jgi:hypothetical protein
VTYEQLLERVITDGITAARTDYADQPDKLQGAVDGFEACRGKNPSDLVALYVSAERRSHEARREEGAPNFWRHRTFALEVEWTCNVVSMGVVNDGGRPLLSWLPTARGALKYAEIVGMQ